jgi:hypothetical protein
MICIYVYKICIIIIYEGLNKYEGKSNKSKQIEIGKDNFHSVSRHSDTKFRILKVYIETLVE